MKKNVSRMLSVILAICMVVSLMPSVWANESADDQMAQLSISAPLTSGSAANIIPEGDIVLGDLFRLYRYENWFYQITMTGKEVRTWLEFAATNVRSDGTASNLTDVTLGNAFGVEDWSFAKTPYASWMP